MSNIKELTPEQTKAFKRLKKAFEDCKRSGIVMFNFYGDLNAYNGKLVNGMSDDERHNSVPVSGNNAYNTLSIPNEWADDEGIHFLHLTSLGLKYISDEY